MIRFTKLNNRRTLRLILSYIFLVIYVVFSDEMLFRLNPDSWLAFLSLLLLVVMALSRWIIKTKWYINLLTSAIIVGLYEFNHWIMYRSFFVTADHEGVKIRHSLVMFFDFMDRFLVLDNWYHYEEIVFMITLLVFGLIFLLIQIVLVKRASRYKRAS